MIQFWFLWVFITLVVVIVALTLRKEREEMYTLESIHWKVPIANAVYPLRGSADLSFLRAQFLIIVFENRRSEMLLTAATKPLGPGPYQALVLSSVKHPPRRLVLGQASALLELP